MKKYLVLLLLILGVCWGSLVIADEYKPMVSADEIIFVNNTKYDIMVKRFTDKFLLESSGPKSYYYYFNPTILNRSVRFSVYTVDEIPRTGPNFVCDETYYAIKWDYVYCSGNETLTLTMKPLPKIEHCGNTYIHGSCVRN